MVADRSVTSSIGKRGAHAVVRERGLTAHIDDHALGTDRVRAEQRTFEKLVRIALEQLTILECARFGFVAVHHDVGGPLRRQQLPFLCGRERAPAAPPGESGGADFREHLARVSVH